MKARHEEAGAMILAGGDGTRLLPLTRRIAGLDLPKQFSPILGKETLLEQTRRRVLCSFSPEQTVTVVSRAHERFYSPLISQNISVNLAIQPANRGTAAAILFGLLRLSHLRRIDTVAIFPSDHYVSNDMIFMRHVDAAISAASSLPVKIVLLGIPADRPESDYGWIEPGEQITQPGPGVAPIFRISRFWEKPAPYIAVHLWSRGLLWNSFVMVAQVGALLDLFARMTPQLHTAFAEIGSILDSSFGSNGIDKLYAGVPSQSFSEAILAGCSSELSVIPATGVEWNDLGDPSRVMATLAKIRKQHGCLVGQ